MLTRHSKVGLHTSETRISYVCTVQEREQVSDGLMLSAEIKMKGNTNARKGLNIDLQ
jgi:hypothetical protein